MTRCLACVFVFSCMTAFAAAADDAPPLRAAVFDVDATPPVGSQMAYDPVAAQGEPGLRARGVVLLGADAPVVLCAVDWIGIANGAHDAFRDTLAGAAGTSRERVAVHTLHQHDAPACDFSAEALLGEHGLPLKYYDGAFAREVLARLDVAVRAALEKAQPVTHIGTGAARVYGVASNRRILGGDGKVRAMRFTTCAEAALRAEPEGVIDPEVSLVSLWNGDAPVAVLSYYATHPQSYYRTGVANPDYPGIARFMRQLAVPGALHVHFTGAAGNVGAGKYNDGARENRLVLARRLADGMERAWNATVKTPVAPADLRWETVPVALPPAAHLSLEKFEAALGGAEAAETLDRHASEIAWLRRLAGGRKIDVGCLSLGRARILHLPGELFVEYQLAAKSLGAESGLFTAMAAYGDGAPGYIGTAAAYEQGGYETGEQASNVSPEAETVLMSAIRELLKP